MKGENAVDKICVSMDFANGEDYSALMVLRPFISNNDPCKYEVVNVFYGKDADRIYAILTNK